MVFFFLSYVQQILWQLAYLSLLQNLPPEISYKCSFCAYVFDFVDVGLSACLTAVNKLGFSLNTTPTYTFSNSMWELIRAVTRTLVPVFQGLWEHKHNLLVKIWIIRASALGLYNQHHTASAVPFPLGPGILVWLLMWVLWATSARFPVKMFVCLRYRCKTCLISSQLI